jgi:hypothetical protein
MLINKLACITFIKDPWGGREHLWCLSANEAIAQHTNNVLLTIDVGEKAPTLIELKTIRAKLHLRRGFINSKQLVSYFDLDGLLFFHGKVNDIRKCLGKPFLKIILSNGGYS